MTLIKMNKFQPIVIYPLMMTVSYLSNMVFIVISTDYYKNSNNISNQEQSTNSKEPTLNDIVNNNHNIILLFISYIFQSFTLILSYVQKKRTLKNKLHNMELIPGNKKDKILVILSIIFLSLLIISTTTIQLYFTQTTNKNFLEMSLKGSSLVVATLLCKLFLHYTYYQHHWVGLGSLVIGYILFAIFDIKNEINEIIQISSKGSDIGICTIIYIWVVSEDVIEKYLMEKKYISPFAIIGLEGIVGLIIMLIIICIIKPVILKELATFYFQENRGIIVVFDILFAISWFFYNIMRLMTNQNFFPTYIAISTVLGDLCIWIFKVIMVFAMPDEEGSNPPFYEYLLKIISYCFILFGITLYLEIIQVNAFGLNLNTKQSIMERTGTITERDLALIENDVEEDEEEKTSIQ